MKHIWTCSVLLTLFAVGAATRVHAESWPGWRGPRFDGTSVDQNAPTNWDSTNVTWKVELPGKGHASAIAWGDYVYTVTASTQTLERVLICVERDSGKIHWQETVVKGPLEKIHSENSYASSTPVTDGERIYVTFRVGDDIVVAAHDSASGKQLWRTKPGTHVSEWGFNSAPVLYKDKVIVDGDSKGNSFLVALSRDKGETLWSVTRTNKGMSYSTPLVREMAGRPQLIQCGDRRVASFDPDTGKEIWTVDGPSQEFIVSPLYDAHTGFLFISSAYPAQNLLPIRPDGTGNVAI